MSFKIYDHMIMNQQSISVTLKPAFALYFKSELDINVHIHASNVYLFTIPLAGEMTQLSSDQKKFIFKNELSLYEAQYEFNFPYEEALFDRFFEITWHGVVYHGEIKSL
ncbi:MAG: hypothetical protein JNM24_11215 [Bdellovibrionaceae bacterium]|nr:hypothetical protein [Pseudobdellovibrionaceae bacterium]